jgi:hypothetical protein
LQNERGSYDNATRYSQTLAAKNLGNCARNLAWVYASVFTLIVIAVLLILLWFLCGEKPRVLNLRSGSWWKDLLGGIVLVGLTLSVKFF